MFPTSVKKVSLSMPRKFISHSEAEEETEEEDSPEELDFSPLRGRNNLTAVSECSFSYLESFFLTTRYIVQLPMVRMFTITSR